MSGAVQIRFGDDEIQVITTAEPERVELLLHRLDGRHERAALATELGTELVESVLAELMRAGLLIASSPSQARSGYWSHVGPSADPTALQNARVAVVGHEPATAVLATVLAEHGLKLETGLNGAEVAVCVIEQPDLARLFAVQDAASAARLPCLFVDLSHGRHATIGPFYIPGDGACYRCLRSRLGENSAAYSELAAAEQHMLRTEKPLPAFGCLPAHRYLVAGLAALELIAFLARHRPLRTLNRVITVALEQARSWSEPAWRVPWCPGCSALSPP